MDFEHHKWNMAELEFSHWLKGAKVEGPPAHANILKSTFLVFREKESERLTHFCNQGFAFFREKELRVSDDEIRFSKKSQIINENRVAESHEILNFFLPDESANLKRRTKAENATIIQGIVSGDQSIFNDLYEYEFPKVVRLIIKNSGTLDAAKDVFQDALVIMMEKIHRRELDLTCSVGTYLYSICRNLWMEQLRKDQKSISFDPFSNLVADISYMHEQPSPDVFETVQKAIENLGDPCRQLLESFYYENLGWVEIARSLGYSNAASARNQKYKCLERIRKAVDVEEE